MSHTTPNSTSDTARIGVLTESERHRVLASERRRVALDVLADRSTPVELADLAADVAVREDGLDASGPEPVSSLEVDLHHVHLPKLDALGLIDYDPERGRITL